MMPFLSGYIRYSMQHKPMPQALKEVANNFAGLPALGIRDYTEKTEIVLPDGRRIDYETIENLEKVTQKETSIMLSIEDAFIKSGLMPKEFYKSPEYITRRNDLLELHEGKLSKTEIDSLSGRIQNILSKSRMG